MEVTYLAEWAGVAVLDEALDAAQLHSMFHDALVTRRNQEIDRGVTLVGPHRDDVTLKIDGLDARTQSSQGEQRSLALALRLAGHHVTTTIVRAAPVLLLDDVFSELDDERSRKLIEVLPKGQTLFSTATTIPAGIAVDETVRVHDGQLTAT